MKLTFYGHATFGLELAGRSIIIDPFLSGNDKCDIEPASLDCDLMLLSHGHQDHILDAEAIASRTGCKVLCNYEVGNWLMAKGVENITQVNPGGSMHEDKLQIKYVNAVHSSSMPDGSYGGCAGGFIIRSSDICIYYAGDTALHMDMELIGRYEKPDLAILPIGDTFTMGYEDAAIASEMIDCKRCIGMHFDTWPPLAIDHQKATTAFAAKGAELTLMNIGQTLNI